jgi:hypothetical protein
MSRTCVIFSGMDNNNWTPWTDYPPLTQERLSTVASIIRQARRDTLILYDPLRGDNSWSHGCRAYVRSIFALTEASKSYSWLTVLPEVERLRATFAIAGIPFRFYRGMPDDPPTHYLGTTFAETRQLQMAFKTGFEGLLRPIDRIFRVAVETDPQGETTDISWVEVDDAGNVTNSYIILPAVGKSNVAPAQAAPIELPPPTVGPLRTEQQRPQKKTQRRKRRMDERDLVS